jgi:hypothetical protein
VVKVGRGRVQIPYLLCGCVVDSRQRIDDGGFNRTDRRSIERQAHIASRIDTPIYDLVGCVSARNAYRVCDDFLVYGEAGYARENHSLREDRDAHGTYITFDPPGAGTGFAEGTLAIDINLGGTITGYYQDNNLIYHGFVRTANGAFGIIDVPGAGTEASQGTTAESINDVGSVTGFYTDNQYGVHGFIFKEK